MPPNFNLPKKERLLKSGQFRFVLKNKTRLFCRGHAMIFAPNSLAINRLGLVAPKAKVRLSSTRNRTRRFLREAYRQSKNKFKAGYDIILIINSPVDSLSGAEEIISEMFDKAKIRAK